MGRLLEPGPGGYQRGDYGVDLPSPDRHLDAAGPARARWRRMKATWIKIEGSPDYRDSTGALIAVYKSTVAGHGNYWTFPVALAARRRTMGRAVAVGGLYAGDVSNLLPK